jgi:hypothetical protein
VRLVLTTCTPGEIVRDHDALLMTAFLSVEWRVTARGVGNSRRSEKDEPPSETSRFAEALALFVERSARSPVRAP